MNPQKYLEQIITQQTLVEDGPEMKALNEEKTKVENLILREFKDSNPTIKIAGSIAKGTAIKDSYDLDVCSYFSNDDTECGDTLKDIYQKVKACLEKEYYVLQKPVALRLQSISESTFGVDYHIDVVPGRFVDDTTGDCYLNISFGEKDRFKTNLKVHIKHIKDSKLIDQIKLLKIWKNCFGLSIRTFILELLVIKILKNSKAKLLEDFLIEFWKKLKNNIESIAIEDPANPHGNDLSETFDGNIKSELKDAAERSLSLIEKDNWEEVFGPLESLDRSNIASTILTTASTYNNPPKPYSDDMV